MSNPDTTEEILQSHAGLIHRIVMHCNAPGSVPDIDQVLKFAEDNISNQLVTIIREIMSGKRKDAIPLELEEETRVIAEAIVKGLENPETLPVLETDINSEHAGIGIAGLIYAACTGNEQALRILMGTAKQMRQAGGDMDIMAQRIRQITEGERTKDKLTDGMEERGQKMVLEIIDELSRLEENQNSA